MLLKEAVGEFLEYLLVELNRSPATQKGYKKDLNIFIKFLESKGREDIVLEELTPELLSEYLRYLTRDRGCRPNTVRRRVTALKSFCSFLVDTDYLERNPASSLPRPRMPQKHPRYLQKEEVDRLFSVVPPNSLPSTVLRDKTALVCLYYTGARVNELVHIRKDDLDFEHGFVKINKGKGSRFRKVPLHLQLEKQVKKYLQEAPELVNGYLFCNRQGSPLTTDYVHHIIRQYAERAGLKNRVTPHMLRHSFATHLYRKGVNITTLSKLLGHIGIRSTAVYMHSDLEHLREGVDRLYFSQKLAAKISRMEGHLSEPAVLN